MNKIRLIIFFVISLLGVNQSVQAVTLQELLQGYDYPQSQVLGTATLAVTATAKGSADTSASTIASADTLNVNTGDLLVAVVAHYNSTARTVSSLTDGTNNFTLIPNSRYIDADGSVLEMWYKENATAKSVATFTANLSGSALYRRILIWQISGAATSGALDQISTPSVASATTQTCNNITTTQADEIMLAGISEWAAHSFTAGSSFNNRYVNPTTDFIALDRIVASTGTYPNGTLATVSSASDNKYVCLVASFKAGTSGGVSDTTAPTVPTNLSATAVSSSGINLSWTASTDSVGVTGYKIYRNGTQIGTTASTSYSDTGLSASTNYSYTVSAVDGAGNNSAQSSSASATTQSAPVGGSANYYISPSGNDSNNCTSAGSACLTINGALQKSSAGQTIEMAAGTYGAQNISVSKSSPGVTVKCVSVNSGATSNSCKTGAISAGGSWYTIQDVTIDVGDTVHGSGWGVSGSNITFKNVKLHGDFAAGYMSAGTSNFTWDGGEWGDQNNLGGRRSCANQDGYYLYMLGDSAITNITLKNMDVWPMQIDATPCNGDPLHMETIRIDGNINGMLIDGLNFHDGAQDNTGTIFFSTFRGVPNNVTIQNSYLGTDGNSSIVFGGGTNINIRYNTITGGISQPSTVTNLTITGNAGWWQSFAGCVGTHTKNVWQWDQSFSCGSDKIVIGPQYSLSNLGLSGGYVVQAGSQLINAGETSCAVTKDILGNSRPSGAGCDAGAYEYGGVVTPPSDTTAPTVPTNLSATAVSSSGINLSWTASTDAVGVTGYRIYRAGTQIGTSVSTTYSDSGLSASTNYSYTVSAVDGAENNSAQSSSASATTQAVVTGACSATNVRCVGSGQEYTTIQAASNATVAGDTVVVYPGTYNERVTISRSGSSGSKITYQGFLSGASCPTVVSSDSNSRGFRPLPGVKMQGFDVNANYITIQCFEITNTGSAAAEISPSRTNIDFLDNYVHDGPWVSVNTTTNGGVASTRASYINAMRNYVYKSQYGIILQCNNCVVQDNEFERMAGGSAGTDLDYSRVFGDNIVIRHNYMHGNNMADCTDGDCHIDCVQTWNIGQTDTQATNITIDRNICLNSHEGIIARDTTHATPFSHNNWTITNNVFSDGPIGSTHPWCMIFEHIGNVKVYNNVCNAGGAGFYDGTNVTFKNNIYINGGYNPYGTSASGWGNGVMDGSSNNLLYESGRTYSGFAGDVLNQDPKFVNLSLNNYHLLSTSPAINAAANVGLTVDLDGNSRPQGSGYDIGAFEYTGTVTSGNCTATNVRCVGSGQEYTTIQAAANATVAGDTVVVYPGTYNESVTITRSGSAGSKITFQGYMPGSSCPSTTYADINSRGFRPAPVVTMNGFTASANYIKIDCFNTNGKGVLNISEPNIHDVDVLNNYSQAGAGGQTGVYINDQLSLATSAQNIYVGYNYISGGGYGVLQKCRNCKYEYNEFYQMNPGTSGADGDYARIFGYDITFYKNYMHGNDRNLCGGSDCHIDCFQTFSYTADFPAYNITIDSNVCFNASEGIIATNESKLSVFHDWTIKNNLIAHSPLNYYGAQCMIISDITNATVVNNTCSDVGVTTYANTTTGVHRNNIHERIGTYLAYRMIGGANVTADHNLLYDTGYSYTSSGDVVNKSPLFVNATADNYQLQSNSPAINAGISVGVPVDIINNSRPQGGGYDIGAYEFTGTVISDTTAPTVPTNLSATAVSSSGINLSWTASTDSVGVTGYKIYRNGTQIGTTVSTSYSDTGLSASTNYSYTVAAVDGAGNNSAQSSASSATTQSILPIISNLLGSNTTATTTKISWDTNVATNGQIFYGLSSSYGSQSSLVDNTVKTTTHSIVLSSLSPATLYHFKVTSIDALGNSTSSPDFTFTTLALPLPPAPTISSFTASPTSITSGQSTTLTWSVANATSLSINQGVGTVTGSSKSVSPTITTTYTLTATGAGGTATAQVTVTVVAPPPTVSSFTASPTSITSGQSTTLTWSVANATSLSINQGVGTVTGSSKSVSPTITTTYTLTATGAGGTATAQVTVTVVAPPPTVSSFTASPTSITSGQSTTLAWSVANATSLSINQGVGTVTGSSKSVSPTITTTYTLTATGAGGTATAQVSVNVTNPVATTTAPTIISFSANPNSLIAGQDSTLTWSVTGNPAPTINISPSVGTTTSTSVIVNPTQTTTYTLTASNSAGIATAQMTISATALPVDHPTGGGGGGGGGSSGTASASNPGTIIYISPIKSASSNFRLINNQGTYYLISKGQRQGITNPGMLASYGFNFSMGKSATAEDLALPQGPLLTPNDGALVKSKEDPTVYLISKQQRYGFVSEAVFKGLGFNFSSVLVVTNPELQVLSKAINLDNGQAQHLAGLDINKNGTIYWIGTDNKLYAYPSLEIYNSWHLPNDFSRVVPANIADMSLPMGEFVSKRVVE